VVVGGGVAVVGGVVAVGVVGGGAVAVPEPGVLPDPLPPPLGQWPRLFLETRLLGWLLPLDLALAQMGARAAWALSGPLTCRERTSAPKARNPRIFQLCGLRGEMIITRRIGRSDGVLSIR
jgi:hypothetical protein